jgi:hypothetical protein
MFPEERMVGQINVRQIDGRVKDNYCRPEASANVWQTAARVPALD